MALTLSGPLGLPSYRGSPDQPLLLVSILGSGTVLKVGAVASAMSSSEDPQYVFVIRHMRLASATAHGR